ncbi:MAG: YfbK domain-containing protein [Candidatus Limnocylindrales bacterium]
MRQPLLTLAVVALVASGCAAGSSSAPAASQGARPPDQHHAPTPDPYPPVPAATPYRPAEVPDTNPYVDPDEDRVSTFALDIDTASYALAAGVVRDGGRPDPRSVRVEEWVNAFDHDYPAPDDAAFAVVADGGATPFTEPDEVLLRIGLRARDVRDRARAEAALTFVIDTSGSMSRGGRLELVKASLHRLVDGLGRGDTIAIVTFGDDARVVLPPTDASRADDIRAMIDDLRPGGSTNLEAGLRLGYGLARETLTENGIDRVLLASDGVANVGLTDPDGILGAIREDAAAGIELISVGVGMGDYNDALLEQLADDGDGFYAYVNDGEEATRLFTVDLTGSLQAVALDARAQVEFDPDAVAAYRLLGYENRAVDDRDFTDDSVDAGAIGAGHDVTALYALRLRDDVGRDDVLATVRLRWTDPEQGGADDLAADVRFGDLARVFGRTDPTFRRDAIVAATAEVLRASPWMARTSLRDVADVAFREAGALPATDQVHDFLDLLDALAAMEE